MKWLFPLALGLIVVSVPAFSLPEASTDPKNLQNIQLWPGAAPGTSTVKAESETQTRPSDSHVAGQTVLIISQVSQPTMTLYLPSERQHQKNAPQLKPWPTVVVFPGGGYYVLAYDLEGIEPCTWLNHLGIACVLVKYRVPGAGPYPKSIAALQDAQRAVGLVRSQATLWNLDPKRIGVLGFSAGGHLSAVLANHYEHREYSDVDESDRVSCRPDFEMLIYPAYLSVVEGSLELNNAVQPTQNTPPTFLVQTENDSVHVENALAYFAGLKAANVAAELHIYSEGGHGYGLRRTDLPVTQWTTEAEKWLHTIDVLR